MSEGDTRNLRGGVPVAPIEHDRTAHVEAVPVVVDRYAGFSWANYVLDVKLGEGAMGVVYRLRHRDAGDLYKVVKFLKPTSNSEIGKRFHQEFSVAASLPSYYVVRPDDFGQLVDGTYFFIMEYVTGRTLEKELETGPLAIKDALQIATRLADAVTEIDEGGVVHRDLKPANIFLYQARGRDRRLKLLDFGVSKVRGTRKEVGTRHDAIIGTLGYMAPEGIGAQHEIDGRFDVFSLGVVIYEMVAGRLPFPIKPDIADMMTTMFSTQPQQLHLLRPMENAALLRDLDAIVRRTISMRPSERPRPAEVHKALDALYRRLVDDAVQSGVPSTKMPTLLTGTPRTSTPDKTPTLVKSVDVEAMMDRAAVPPTSAPPVSVSAQPATQPKLPAPVVPTQPSLRAPARAGRPVVMVVAAAVIISGLCVGGLFLYSRRAAQRENTLAASVVTPTPKAIEPTPPTQPSPQAAVAEAPAPASEKQSETAPVQKKHTAKQRRDSSTPATVTDDGTTPRSKSAKDGVWDPFGGK